jgi:molybdopterin-guanine dinucleotide biosynthesis protein A
MIATNDITALILAGGAGRRVGHRDKGLLLFHGKPYIAHVSERLQSQVKEVLISCNRNASDYARFCSKTVVDRRLDFQGPLAGLEAAAPLITTQVLVVVACDMPHLPDDLVAKLVAPLSNRDLNSAQISYVNDGIRPQYLCAAIKRKCLPSLTEFLDQGGRAVKEWFARNKTVAVDFSQQRSCFRNYNTLQTRDI